jgi:acetoin utilization deacetylase AcuC-like enzyme
MENTIAVVDDPVFLDHRGEEGHPERPERLEAARQGLSLATHRKGAENPTGAGAGSEVLEASPLAARDASDDELVRVHTAEYVSGLSRIQGRHGYLDADTFFSPASYAAARRAAGGAIAMVDALLDGTSSYGLALVRPPGHHARPGGAMGFCLLNNVAVAAAHARSRGARRVAIVDWDVHHGNGTQEMFYSNPEVLYVSLHQYPFYPGTGGAAETGHRDGEGFTVNVPLSPGAGDEVYVAAFERLIGPIVEQYDPDLLLVSAGSDAHVRDPLAAMRVTENGYARMTQVLVRALPRGAPGRVGIVLEGGYDLEGLTGSLRATLEALVSPTPEKSAPAPRGAHDAELESARRALGRYWKLD